MVSFPPPLRPGELIAIVAPSGACDAESARRGITWLASRYKVRHRTGAFARDGYLAGSDRRRTSELQAALDGPARAIVAARGGYGLSRIVADLDWRGFLVRPKWLVGFSDFTVLHLEAWRRRVASIHAPMVCALGGADERTRTNWIAALEQPAEAREFAALEMVRPGRARGVLVGGNLAMLHAAAAAGRLRLPRRSVLLIEDVGERPYRVDRMLTTLLDGGHLRAVCAVVLGDFTQCEPGPDGRTVQQVLRERLARLAVPVVSGLPVGHGDRNDALILGAEVVVTATRSRAQLQALG